VHPIASEKLIADRRGKLMFKKGGKGKIKNEESVGKNRGKPLYSEEIPKNIYITVPKEGGVTVIKVGFLYQNDRKNKNSPKGDWARR